ncbi:MAG: DUF2812 domain-containing protein [Gudongella sp.]|nr:DUF2812 domain-containing protein [Gudongella sp.]
MRDKKIVIDGLTTQDFEIMEMNFRNMANKGLLIEKIKFGLSFYKRIQPKDLEFAIGIYPRPKAYEKPEGHVVDSYIKAQEKKGWKHLFSQEYTHVFINEKGEELEDIDKVEQVDNIKATLKLEIISFAILTLLNIFNMTRMSGIEIYNFNSNMGLISIFIMPVITTVIASYAILNVFRYIRISKKSSKDEVKVKNITGIKVFRKATFIITLLLLALFMLAILADSFISGTRTIFIMLPMFIAFFVAFKLRGFFAGRNLGTVGKTLIAFVVVFFILGISTFIGISSIPSGFDKDLPDSYIALRLKDLGFEQEVEEVFFEKDGSILMPVKYRYTEHINFVRPRSTYVSTQAAKAVNKNLAEYIFELELKNSIRYRGIPVSAKDFYSNFDKAKFIEDPDGEIEDVILQRDKYIFVFSGDFDLKEPGNIDLINDMVDKIISNLN